jgi:hypothetical protein
MSRRRVEWPAALPLPSLSEARAFARSHLGSSVNYLTPIAAKRHQLLRRPRDRSLVEETTNAPIGKRMTGYMNCYAAPKDRIVILHDWPNANAIQPMPSKVNSPSEQGVSRESWNYAKS